jgi:hypothetical protein
MGESVRYPDAVHTEGDGWGAVIRAVDSLRDEVGQRHAENTSTLEVMEGKLNEVITRVDDLHRGFPDGDPDSHCRYHETLIRKAEARADLYEELRAELVKKGLWALLVLMGIAVWQFVKGKLTT